MSRFGYIDNMRQQGPPPDMPFMSPGTEVFPHMQSQSPGFPLYRQNPSPPQIREAMPVSQPYMPQTPTGQSNFNSPTTAPNMQSLLDAAQRSMSMDQAAAVQEPFGPAFYDSNDLSKYNFDPSTFNFGNHYGALEFGMLGQMATGAAETPPSDAATQMGQNYTSPQTVGGFGDSPARDRSFSLGGDQTVQGWQQPSLPPDIARMDHQHQYHAVTPRQKPLPMAIPMNISHTLDMSGRPTGALTPPATDTMTPHMSGAPGINITSSSDMYPSDSNGPPSSVLATARLFAPQQANRDTSVIYSSVQKEYSYVTSWHNLTAFIRKRFPSEKVNRVAKAISAFRPSFIGATKSLNKDDLIFMEKCFQRTLCIYEDFLAINCTPTIVCRRTGEIAAVSDEFVQLTGWSRDILLGRAANLNSNTGKAYDGMQDVSLPGSGAATATNLGRGGVNTPRTTELPVETSRPQAVFHAELMDDDSVIKFYEDFARLAFGEPRGRVNTSVRLLKYRTKADMANSSRKREAGGGWADQFGMDEGAMECQCAWTIKRDVFDLPMMIVMNVSAPRIPAYPGLGLLSS